ncbi:hypothetical protein AHiyo4_22620 [Arthrobacter sp. Hiyo4]|nr:hypothetical protein AHiyo4_22620 [Arthrobacter sp. Hiyo4]
MPAQGLDHGRHLDQRAGSGRVVAVERQFQLARLGGLGRNTDVEVVLANSASSYVRRSGWMRYPEIDVSSTTPSSPRPRLDRAFNAAL